MSCPAKFGAHSFCSYERLMYILYKQNAKKKKNEIYVHQRLIPSPHCKTSLTLWPLEQMHKVKADK